MSYQHTAVDEMPDEESARLLGLTVEEWRQVRDEEDRLQERHEREAQAATGVAVECPCCGYRMTLHLGAK